MEIKVTYNIYEIRQSKGISSRKLSEFSGVSKSQISSIENGQKDATLTTLCMLALALGVQPNDLYKYEVL